MRESRRSAGARRSSRSSRRGGSLDEALVGESESHFRVDGVLRPVTTRFYDRDLLPLDESIAGAAVVFHLDTTTVVPPGWSARADASGNLMLNRACRDERRADAGRPDHRGRGRRCARLDRGRDGPQARPDGVLLDHPGVRGLRLRDLRRPGAAAVRVVAVDAAPVRPDPRLHRRHQPSLRRARPRLGARATSSSTTTRTTAPRTSRTSASSFRSTSATSSSGSRRRPPTTSTSARSHPGAAGSSTPPMRSPRGSSSTRSRSRRAVAGTRRSGSSCATTAGPRTSSSATWRPRSRPARSAPGASSS